MPRIRGTFDGDFNLALGLENLASIAKLNICQHYL